MALSTGARRIQSVVVLAESDDDQVRVALGKKQKDDVTDSFSRIQLWRQKNAERGAQRGTTKGDGVEFRRFFFICLGNLWDSLVYKFISSRNEY